MKIIITILLSLTMVAAGCNDTATSKNLDTKSTSSDYSSSSDDEDVSSFDDGYEYASDNDIDNFDDCQYEFSTSDAEDGCNEYVKENHTGYQEFNGYACTEDCSGHEAGYEWAEENGIEDEGDCDGNSDSFIEGCYSYVEENY